MALYNPSAPALALLTFNTGSVSLGPPGSTTYQAQVTGVWNDLESGTLTNAVKWSSSNTGLVTVNNSGLLTWVAGPGTASITSTFLNVTNSFYAYAGTTPSIVTIFSATVDTFIHAKVTASAISGIIGGNWGVLGTAPTWVAASAPYPEGASTDGVARSMLTGAFSNLFASTTGNWAAAIVLKFYNTRTGVGALGPNGGSGRGDGGFWVYNRADGQVDYQGGGGTLTSAGTSLPADGNACVVMIAASGTSGYVRVNKGNIVTGARPGNTTTAFGPAMGSTQNATNDANKGVYYEFYAEQITGSWANSIFDRIYNSASSSLSGQLP